MASQFHQRRATILIAFAFLALLQMLSLTNQAQADGGVGSISFVRQGPGNSPTNNQYLSIPPSTNYAFDADFTVETWVKFNTLDSFQAFLGQYVGGGWSLQMNNDRLRFSGNIGGSYVELDSNKVFSTNTWYHIALVRYGTATNNIKIYVDGVATTASSVGWAIDNQRNSILGDSLKINTVGGGTAAGADRLNGYISNIRYVKGTAVYTSDFTPPTSALTAISGTVLLLNTNSANFAKDNSQFNATVTPYNDASTTTGLPVADTSSPFPKSNQTISFSALGNKTLGMSSFALEASASSAQPVVFTSATVGTCTVSGSTVSLVAAGSCTINADQAGNANYNAAQQVQQSFTIFLSQLPLAVNAASGTFGSTTTLGMTGGSGTGAVSYTVVSGNCSVSGDVLSNTSAGNCVLTATKAGDGTYGAITSAQVTIAIAKKTLVFPYSISSSTGTFTYGATYIVSMTFPADALAGIGTWNVLKASTAYGINAPGDQVCTGATVTVAGAYTCSFNSASMYPSAQALAISGLHVRFTGSNNYNSFSHTTDGTKISITGCDFVFCANSSAVTVTATNKTINFGTNLGGVGFETPYGDTGGQLRYTISNGANGATKAWGVSCTSTYTTGAAVGTYPIICTSTTRPTGSPTPITDDWVAQNTNYPQLYNANADNLLYTLKNPINPVCGSAAQWWIKCSFYTSDTYSNLSFVNGVLTVQKATLGTPITPSAAAVAGSPSTVTVSYTQVANAVSHTAKVYASNGITLLQTIPNYSSGDVIAGLSASTEYKFSITAIGDGTNTNNSNESSKVNVTTNTKSTSRTIVFPTTSYSLNYGSTQTVSATVSARANIPTITFDGNANTNTNPQLTTGISGNQGVNGNFFGYSVNEGSFTEGQIVTMSDLRAGSTVTYSGKLHFLWGGGFGWAFFITDILSVTGSSVNATSSKWLLTGEGAITYSAGASTACSVDRWTGQVSITSGTGTCEISSTVVEDSEYQAMTTTVPVSITVNKIAQSALTLSLSASSKNAPYSQALTITPSGGTGSGAITYAIVAGGTASGCALANSSSSNTISATSGGTCLVQATKAADSNYSATTSSTQTFTFSASNQVSILVLTSTSGTYGTDLNLTTSGGSGSGVVSFATSTAGCSLPTSNTLRATGPIICQVTATKAADVDYNEASSELTNVTFTSKQLTITGLIGVNKEFDGLVTSSVSGSPSLSGIVDGDVVTLLGVPTFTFATASVANSKLVSASGYTLTGTNSSKYTLVQPTVTANISKKSATVTATSSTVAIGSPYTPTFTFSGLIGSDSITAVTYSFSSTGTGTPPIIISSSVVTPSAAVFGVLGAEENYNLSYVTGTLNIVSSFQVLFKSNFTSSDTSTVTANFAPGDAPITPATPTRSNFTFLGWYSLAVGGNKVNGAITPSADASYWAHWIQNSLNGMGSATKIGTFTTDIQYLDTFTRSGDYGTVTISIPAGALPHQTLVDIYQVTDPTRANSLLVGSNYVLSLVVAWLAPDATVPTTQSGKPVTMTISNVTIKKGAKVYAIVNDVVTLLGTAAQDGSAEVRITDDPEVVIVITKPDAPTSVSATSGGNAASTVSWTVPTSDGGSAITGYTATSSGGQNCVTTTTSCSISGLTNGTPYTFTVTASNAIGISDSSTASSPITPSAPAPAPAPAPTPAPSGGGGGGGSVYVAPTPDPAIAIAEAAKAKAAAEKIAADAKAAADLKAAQDKAAAEAAQAAALKAAQELADAQAKADAELKAAQDKALEDARIAEELRMAQEKAEADLRAAAEKKAAEDAAAAALLAAKRIVPNVTLYSISTSLKLSTYDSSYLKKYVSKLKPNTKVTCVGYIYAKNTSYLKAKALASKQAKAVCDLIKKQKKTIITSTLLYPSSKAPKAAAGAKWVAVSYRVDGYKS